MKIKQWVKIIISDNLSQSNQSQGQMTCSQRIFIALKLIDLKE